MNDKLYRYMNWPVIEGILYADEDEPQKVLGMHKTGANLLVQTFQPGAKSVQLLLPEDNKMKKMEVADEEGFFALLIPGTKKVPYRFEVTYEDGSKKSIEDPYRFDVPITEDDLAEFHAGVHENVHHLMGAHLQTIDGVQGCLFTVWAPNVIRASVVGEFNNWDGRVHPMMRLSDKGVFSLFVPGVKEGALYKFELRKRGGETFMKADPYGFAFEDANGGASIVCTESEFEWSDQKFCKKRELAQAPTEPMNIYEVYLGSFLKPKDGRLYCNYREFAPKLVQHLKSLSYTHVEFMPLMEHDKDQSLGYVTTGFYAPTSRYGKAEDLKYLINALHEAGIHVIMDFDISYYSTAESGLSFFDGTPLYEEKDEKRRYYQPADAFLFDFRGREVKNFLLGSILYWVEEFHIDGIRIVDLASMLYLDYGRRDGAYFSNMYGDNVNLEAVEFIRHMQQVLKKRNPGVITIAEETTGWQGVTESTANGGLGFDYKWNIAWKQTFLDYAGIDPIFRSGAHEELTSTMLYAYYDRYVLPLSHDDFSHGNASLLNRVVGEKEDRYAALRMLLAYRMVHPGRKLIFMGQDLGEPDSWHESREVEWYLLDNENHAKLQHMIADIHKLYLTNPALHANDDEEMTFEWVDSMNAKNARITFYRHGIDSHGKKQTLFVLCNFANVMKILQIGVPKKGTYKEIFNTDKEQYGGTGFVNPRAKKVVEKKADGHPYSIKMNMPPLSVLLFSYTEE